MSHSTPSSGASISRLEVTRRARVHRSFNCISLLVAGRVFYSIQCEKNNLAFWRYMPLLCDSKIGITIERVAGSWLECPKYDDMMFLPCFYCIHMSSRVS